MQYSIVAIKTMTPIELDRAIDRIELIIIRLVQEDIADILDCDLSTMSYNDIGVYLGFYTRYNQAACHTHFHYMYALGNLRALLHERRSRLEEYLTQSVQQLLVELNIFSYDIDPDERQLYVRYIAGDDV